MTNQSTAKSNFFFLLWAHHNANYSNILIGPVNDAIFKMIWRWGEKIDSGVIKLFIQPFCLNMPVYLYLSIQGMLFSSPSLLLLLLLTTMFRDTEKDSTDQGC